MSIKKLLLFIFAFVSITSKAQLLQDTHTQQIISKGLDKLYNFEFKAAEANFQKIPSSYSSHPVVDLIEALQLQWENVPIDKHPVALQKYMASLERCRAKAEKLYKIDKYKAEAIFFLLSSHGYIALVHNESNEYAKAANEALKAYSYLKEGFKYPTINPEFYFTSGIYNFYRVQYPESHPIVKSIIWFFEGGNKKTGLQQLEIAVNKAIFSRTEAAYYLTGINLKYEHNLDKALQYGNWLVSNYPNNLVYQMRYAEALALKGKDTEAESKIQLLHRSPEKIYHLAAFVFQGILEEHNKNDKLAAGYYANALKMTPDERYTKDYYAMAYLGLARIFEQNGDNAKAKIFYKKALDYAEYPWLINQAKTGLK